MIVFFFFYMILIVWNAAFGMMQRKGDGDKWIGVYCIGNIILGIALLKCVPL